MTDKRASSWIGEDSAGFEITPIDDVKLLLELNNAAVPDLNRLTLPKAQWLVDHCVVPGLARLNGRIAGLVVVLNDHCDFDSNYYRWFTARYENFLYIDRVVVADWARGQGVAKQLYLSIEDVAREQGMALAADVYSDPPNHASLQLHKVRGFEEVGAQYFSAEKKTAAKLMKNAHLARPAMYQTA